MLKKSFDAFRTAYKLTPVEQENQKNIDEFRKYYADEIKRLNDWVAIASTKERNKEGGALDQLNEMYRARTAASKEFKQLKKDSHFRGRFERLFDGASSAFSTLKKEA